jgi:hypothetical protein
MPDLLLFYCRACGLVRASDLTPWCRHNDAKFEMPAEHMQPIPSWHPCSDDDPSKWTEAPNAS